MQIHIFKNQVTPAFACVQSNLKHPVESFQIGAQCALIVVWRTSRCDLPVMLILSNLLNWIHHWDRYFPFLWKLSDSEDQYLEFKAER